MRVDAGRCVRGHSSTQTLSTTRADVPCLNGVSTDGWTNAEMASVDRISTGESEKVVHACAGRLMGPLQRGARRGPLSTGAAMQPALLNLRKVQFQAPYSLTVNCLGRSKRRREAVDSPRPRTEGSGVWWRWRRWRWLAAHPKGARKLVQQWTKCLKRKRTLWSEDTVVGFLFLLK
jgi:hypothetical protein